MKSVLADSFPESASPQFRPRIGITMGDPAGVGPEIILKAMTEDEVLQNCRPIIIGDANILQETAAKCDLPFDYKICEKTDDFFADRDRALVYNVTNLSGITPGIESSITGQASAKYIEIAVKLWQEKFIEAISTAPISKRALSLANYKYPGHTEFLAQLSDSKEFAMSFWGGKLCIVLLSTHVSLRQAIEIVKKGTLIRLIKLTNRELRKLGIIQPRLAVAGINPHAGEGRLFGDEEADEIIPAIDECQKEGINVRGAFSADTIFRRGALGEFDAIISCYHDQATIAVKSMFFGEAVNVTLGLPFIRTSVDHGTAFDIAGKNLAEHSSMKIAILLAANLYRQSQRLETQN